MSKKINAIHDLQLIIAAGMKGMNALTKEEMADKPNPSKWSKIEILGHLIDSAYNNHRRFILALNQEDYIFDGYEQDDWVIKNQYQTKDKSHLISFWISVNIHLIDMLKDVPDKIFEREVSKHNFHQICMNTIPESDPASIHYLLHDYTFHIEHHLNQIIPDYKKLSKPFEK